MTDAVHPDQGGFPYDNPGSYIPERPVTDADLPDIANPMRYIDSTGPQVARHKNVEEGITQAYDAILDNCPRSAERTLAVRKLQEARMWANAAIVFNGRTYPT